MSVVDNFKYDELRNYYKKWYRPDNQAIIVIGDIDVDHIESVIKDLWKNSTVPADAAKVVPEPVPDTDKAIYVVETDKEQRYSEVGIAMKHDATTPEEKANMMYLVQDYA
ncbi:MAG: insulinase family protein, partial [Lachnospiraceae bacterium]|nr:insulinase family protein [Lachnospiraceae bacterium]